MKFENCLSSDLYALAEEIKRETFELDSFNINPYSFVSPSAYDTAWLAMIEDLNTQKPMFQGCLDWILSNQNVEEGLWGNHVDGNEDETLTSTLACVLSLRKWNSGSLLVHKGNCYVDSFSPFCIATCITYVSQPCVQLQTWCVFNYIPEIL